MVSVQEPSARGAGGRVVVTRRQQAFQPVGVLRSLWRDDADLRQMAAQHVQHAGAIARQQFARAMAHQLRLVRGRAHCREAYVRPPTASQIAFASTASFSLHRT